MVNQIPKLIHYCWFGNNPKPDLVLRCIASWKKYLPDYEIREWNDNDIKDCTNKYVQEAYKSKKWAFISDYFRLYALYNYGGIYLDSDNEVFKSFDDLLNLEFFSGYENWQGIVKPFTAVVGALKNNDIVGDLLGEYEKISFCDNKKNDIITNTDRVSEYFKMNFDLLPPYLGKKKFILKEGCVLFPYNYFCTYDGNVTYAVHHFNGSWNPMPKIKVIFDMGSFKLYKYKNRNKYCRDVDLPIDEKLIFKLNLHNNKYIIFSKKLKNVKKRVLVISQLALRHKINSGSYQYLNSVIEELKKYFDVDYASLRQPKKIINVFKGKNSPNYVYKSIKFGNKSFLNLNLNSKLTNMPLNNEQLNWISNLLKNKDYHAVIVNYTNLCNIFDLNEAAKVPYKVVLTNDIWHKRLELFKKHNLDVSDIEMWNKENEVEFWNKANVIAAIQQEEKELIQAECLDKTVVNLPIPYNKMLSFDEKELSSESKNIICVGGESEVNKQGIEFFINEIFPLVQQRFPAAKLQICGGVCRYFKNISNNNVIFNGIVPDLTEKYKIADCAVVPLLAGSGLKIKLVEAIAHSTPVVTTTIGAQGAESINNFCGYVSDNPLEFANKVVELLTDCDKNKQFSENCLSFLDTYFVGSIAVKELLNVLESRDISHVNGGNCEKSKSHSFNDYL